MSGSTPKYQSNIVRRIFAAILDYGAVYACMFGYFAAVSSDNPESENVENLDILYIFLFWLVLTVGLEWGTGSTIGNGFMRLKVVKEDGISKPSIFQSLIRRLFDFLDLSFVGIIAVILLNVTHKKQRLGDIVARTVVIKN